MASLKYARGFVGREAQVGGPDLQELTSSPQARQRQGRVGPTGDHEVHVRRKVLDQEGHRLVDLRRFDDVVVVEHQHQVTADGLQVVEQRGDDGIDRRLRGVEAALGRGSGVRVDGPQCRHDVGPEQRRVVVTAIEREPCRRWSVGEPIGDEGGLAEPGGGRHEGERGRLTATRAGRAAVVGPRPHAVAARAAWSPRGGLSAHPLPDAVSRLCPCDGAQCRAPSVHRSREAGGSSRYVRTNLHRRFPRGDIAAPGRPVHDSKASWP